MDELSSCPQDRDWFTNTLVYEESNKLELTLAPPGPHKWPTFTTTTTTTTSSHQHNDPLLSLGHHHHHHQSWPSSSSPKFLQHSPSNDAAVTTAKIVKESPLHHCSIISTKMTELHHTSNNNDPTEKIGFLPAVLQKRTAATGPVVGWPPLRSFRKNLSAIKPSPEADTLNGKHGKKTIEETKIPAKGLFVKINMDGIPIGRKVDINSYDSYEKLSSAVDKLFRCLLAAQTDSFADGIPSSVELGKPITGLMDGSGEYTLVYEDNEGDRVLVGDVPWRMFVSTVKRLRVLKTSELTSMRLWRKQPKMEQP